MKLSILMMILIHFAFYWRLYYGLRFVQYKICIFIWISLNIQLASICKRVVVLDHMRNRKEYVLGYRIIARVCVWLILGIIIIVLLRLFWRVLVQLLGGYVILYEVCAFVYGFLVEGVQNYETIQFFLFVCECFEMIVCFCSRNGDLIGFLLKFQRGQ